MKLFHRQRGQTLVEFALTFPLFAMMFFAIIYGGFLASDLFTLNNAARDAAHVAAASTDKTVPESVKNHIRATPLFSKWYTLDRVIVDAEGNEHTVLNAQTKVDAGVVTVYLQAKRTTNNKVLALFLPEAITVAKSAYYTDSNTQNGDGNVDDDI